MYMLKMFFYWYDLQMFGTGCVWLYHNKSDVRIGYAVFSICLFCLSVNA